MVATVQREWKRKDLPTNGIGLDQISGLYLSEQYSVEEIQKKLISETKESYSFDEVHGTYCNVDEVIDCSVEDAYRYAANVYSLEEWTYSLRDVKPEGNGLYRARENLAPNTDIYVRVDCHDKARCVDYLCAWDQGKELWMRYYFRFVDAMPTFGRQGTVMMWLNCKHPYYDRANGDVPQHIKQGQNRTDRPWVGDFWKLFVAGHQMEAQNLKKILEHRFGLQKR